MEATPQIFLSYAREDAEKVEQLYQKLSGAGFKPWMDKKDILPGERWQSSIQKAVQGSDFFLACLSASSVTKRGVLQEEIKDALDIWRRMFESDIYLIPVRLEDCKVPESLRDFQWVNLFEKDGWTRLVKAIQVGMERRTASAGEAVPGVSLPDLKQIRTQELYEQGINALITGKWEKAIISFQQVIDIDKYYKDAFFLLEEAKGQRERVIPLPSEAKPIMPSTRPRVSRAMVVAIAAIIVLIAVGVWLAASPFLNGPGIQPRVSTPSRIPTDTPTRVRRTDNAEMVLVPAGGFTMGNEQGYSGKIFADQGPEHPVDLDAFWIDKFEITNAKYQDCVALRRCEALDLGEDASRFNQDKQPVVKVSWFDAVAYCDWVGARLPTEAEWEKAARGTDKWLFPWGNEFDASKLNFKGQSDAPKPVGSFPNGASPYGALDMSGNVWEWTSSMYKDYPYEYQDGREDMSDEESATRVVRGGAWDEGDDQATTTWRSHFTQGSRFYNTGFRCASSAE